MLGVLNRGKIDSKGFKGFLTGQKTTLTKK